MATYLSNNAFVYSLMFFMMIGSLYAQVAEIATICGKAKNPAFCANFLKASPKADIPTLAKTTFASAETSASGALKQFQSLANTATDPALKKAYTSCVGHYQSAISGLSEAKQSLASSDGGGLNMKVSAAMTGSTTCQTELASLKVDPAAKKNSDDFQNICGIVLVISNMM